MEVIRAGRGFDVVLFLLLLALYVYWTQRALKGRSLPPLRSFAALKGIEDGVGRAVETSKPVHYGLGDVSSLSGTEAAGSVASLAFLGYTARLCARYGARLIVRISPSAQLITKADATVTEAYMMEGKLDELDKSDTLRYHGTGDAYITGGMRDMHYLGAACNVTVGSLSVETVWANAIVRRQGGIGIGGGTRWVLLFGLAMLADYALYGEELYAAAAKISEDNVMISSIVGEDIMKFIIIGLLLVFTFTYLAGAGSVVRTIMKI